MGKPTRPIDNLEKGCYDILLNSWGIVKAKSVFVV